MLRPLQVTWVFMPKPNKKLFIYFNKGRQNDTNKKNEC